MSERVVEVRVPPRLSKIFAPWIRMGEDDRGRLAEGCFRSFRFLSTGRVWHPDVFGSCDASRVTLGSAGLVSQTRCIGA